MDGPLQLKSFRASPPTMLPAACCHKPVLYPVQEQEAVTRGDEKADYPDNELFEGITEKDYSRNQPYQVKSGNENEERTGIADRRIAPGKGKAHDGKIEQYENDDDIGNLHYALVIL